MSAASKQIQTILDEECAKNHKMGLDAGLHTADLIMRICTENHKLKNPKTPEELVEICLWNIEEARKRYSKN